MEEIKQEIDVLLSDAPVFKDEMTKEEEVFQTGINTKFTQYSDLLLEAPRLCSVCCCVFINSYSFLCHNLTHLEVKLTTLTPILCQRCPKEFYRVTDLEAHIKTEHLKLKPSKSVLKKCDICKKIYSRKYWHSHMKEVHCEGEENSVTCETCNKVFKNVVTLSRHQKYVHNKVVKPWRFHKKKENVKFECTECPKVFYNRHSLKSHIKCCHVESESPCPQCSAVFRNELYLRSHLARVHCEDGRTYACDICGKEFKSLRRVRIHKRNSHRLINGLKFESCKVNIKIGVKHL
ncbi:unnamed protein product [Leptosia nina]|uniref:C2H2-type domain-containing protein n=1 Tax=Leptosia nina TaxID=320188 RepID=A0AAV1JLH8_9NEOP